jgi:hypothetical protein
MLSVATAVVSQTLHSRLRAVAIAAAAASKRCRTPSLAALQDDEPGTHVPPVVESGSDEDEDYEQEEEEEEVEEEAASGGSGSEPGGLSADEEEVDESLYGSTDGEGDVYELINRAAGAAYARQLEQFPLLRNWTQPPMQHELAVELRCVCFLGVPGSGPQCPSSLLHARAWRPASHIA